MIQQWLNDFYSYYFEPIPIIVGILRPSNHIPRRTKPSLYPFACGRKTAVRGIKCLLSKVMFVPRPTFRGKIKMKELRTRLLCPSVLCPSKRKRSKSAYTFWMFHWERKAVVDGCQLNHFAGNMPKAEGSTRRWHITIRQLLV